MSEKVTIAGREVLIKYPSEDSMRCSWSLDARAQNEERLASSRERNRRIY
jgi:hypothetical protein